MGRARQAKRSDETVKARCAVCDAKSDGCCDWLNVPCETAQRRRRREAVPPSLLFCCCHNSLARFFAARPQIKAMRADGSGALVCAQCVDCLACSHSLSLSVCTHFRLIHSVASYWATPTPCSVLWLVHAHPVRLRVTAESPNCRIPKRARPVDWTRHAQGLTSDAHSS